MNDVKVKRTDLLDIVRKNLEKHKTIVAEAFDNYRAEAIQQLDEMISLAKSGKKIRRAISLVEPQDQSADYNAAVKMLEMSQDDFISIDEHTFRCLVLDEWAWKRQWSVANSGYVKSMNLMDS